MNNLLLERLLTSSLADAKFLLEKHNEFYPFANTIRDNGEESIESIYTEEHPNLHDSIKSLKSILFEKISKGEICAFSIIYIMKLAYPVRYKNLDAITMDTILNDKSCNKFVYPYKIKHDKIIYYKPFGMKLSDIFETLER